MIEPFSAAVERAPVHVLHVDLEPIRSDGGAEGLMLVVRRL